MIINSKIIIHSEHDWLRLLQYCKGKSYSSFIHSKYWSKIRKLILIRDNYTCYNCKSRIGDMHVHHLTYKNHFNEHNHLEDLVTLCKKCHYNHHN